MPGPSHFSASGEGTCDQGEWAAELEINSEFMSHINTWLDCSFNFSLVCSLYLKEVDWPLCFGYEMKVSRGVISTVLK